MAQLISVDELRDRLYDSATGLLSTDDDATELAIGAASDHIERYMNRSFLVAKHRIVLPPYPGLWSTIFEKWCVFTDQWPVLSIASVSNPKTDDPITDSGIEPFFMESGWEKLRYLSVPKDKAIESYVVEYWAGYRKSDESNADVNTRLGTNGIEYPVLPDLIAKSVAQLVQYQFNRTASDAEGRDNVSHLVTGEQVQVRFIREGTFERSVIRNLQPFRALT